MANTQPDFFAGYENAREGGNATIVSYYDKEAEIYEKSMENRGYIETTHYGANTLKEYLLENNKDKKAEDFEVLDLGCGSGLTGASLDQSGFKLIDGVDPSKGMRELAAKRNVYRNLFDGLISEKPISSIPDASYDGILCVGCFTSNHIDLKEGLSEILRKLKTGGIAVYSVSTTMDLIGSLKKHFEFFEQKKFEMLKIEKKFYLPNEGYLSYCNFYVVRKM